MRKYCWDDALVYFSIQALPCSRLGPMLKDLDLLCMLSSATYGFHSLPSWCRSDCWTERVSKWHPVGSSCLSALSSIRMICVFTR